MTRRGAGLSILPLCPLALGLLIAAGAAAQTLSQTGNQTGNPTGNSTGNPTGNPPMTAPIVITAPPLPPAAARRQAEPAAPAAQPQRPPREDADNRTLLGAPTFIQPGTATPYAAPQYPTSGGPAYTAPGYGPGAGVPAGRTCRQYAPAYDEAGRFLADVCIR